jgi:hypothetical protein
VCSRFRDAIEISSSLMAGLGAAIFTATAVLSHVLAPAVTRTHLSPRVSTVLTSAVPVQLNENLVPPPSPPAAAAAAASAIRSAAPDPPIELPKLPASKIRRGDYVVHRRYGIGLFEGVHQMTDWSVAPDGTRTRMKALKIRYRDGVLDLSPKNAASQIKLFKRHEDVEAAFERAPAHHPRQSPYAVAFTASLTPFPRHPDGRRYQT